MKKIAVFLLFAGILISCKKHTDTNAPVSLTGKWKLAEILSDPGDGSGTFHAVSSEKILEFRTDGTLVSNGSICDLSLETNAGSTGTYSLADSTLSSAACSDPGFKIRFVISGSFMTISYPCIEACAAKYVKN